MMNNVAMTIDLSPQRSHLCKELHLLKVYETIRRLRVVSIVHCPSTWEVKRG